MKPIWWLPTFGFFLFLAIELWMFAGPTHLSGPGVGRHLRTAEVILETAKSARRSAELYQSGTALDRFRVGL